MTYDQEDTDLMPPCERCQDEPVAVDDSGFTYAFCSGCLLLEPDRRAS